MISAALAVSSASDFGWTAGDPALARQRAEELLRRTGGDPDVLKGREPIVLTASHMWAGGVTGLIFKSPEYVSGISGTAHFGSTGQIQLLLPTSFSSSLLDCAVQWTGDKPPAFGLSRREGPAKPVQATGPGFQGHISVVLPSSETGSVELSADEPWGFLSCYVWPLKITGP